MLFPASETALPLQIPGYAPDPTITVGIFATRLFANSIRNRYPIFQLRRLFFSINLKLVYDVRYDCKRWKICKALLLTYTYNLLSCHKLNYFGESVAIILIENLFRVATSFVKISVKNFILAVSLILNLRRNIG